MRLAQPVEVSLWTTQTALMRCARVGGECRADRGRVGAAAPVGVDEDGSRPSRSAISCHSVANQPVRHISTASPGDSVLTSAASQAPVPEAGIDHHRPARCGRRCLSLARISQAEAAEFRAAMVDRRAVDRAQHAVGHVGGPRDLQEMPAGR